MFHLRYTPIPILALLLTMLGCGPPRQADSPASGDATSAGAPGYEVAALADALGELLERGNVPGAAFALIRDGAIVGVRGLGAANVLTGEPVTAETLFEAASLSKPVFAYGVLKLVERGELDLDRPLSEYLAHEDLQGDERASGITARRVLSHTSGLPNWRPRHWSDAPGALTFAFEPGERFGYSGEGFVYLQRVVEHLTGSSLEDFARREIFDPLGMASSSYLWSEGAPQLVARPHDFMGEVQDKRPVTAANAAASLHTTAGDSARFVVEVLDPRHIGGAMVEAALEIQVEAGDGVAWGLGWGLEPGVELPTFWHWGDNGDFRCFVMASRASGDGLVLFTNSNNGLAIAGAAVGEVLAGDHPAFAWLDYDRHDASGFRVRERLVRAGLDAGAEGVDAALAELEASDVEGGLPEPLINRIGYDLLGRERLAAAIAVFEWNVEHFPESANVYDSLAEAHAENGDTEAAIRHYKKSLELDPGNDNARAMLAKLE